MKIHFWTFDPGNGSVTISRLSDGGGSQAETLYSLSSRSGMNFNKEVLRRDAELFCAALNQRQAEVEDKV
jgi:hypothetical protein